MKKKSSTILLGLGAIFMLYAIFGRYLVLPGYLEGLETGGGTLGGAAQIASPWEIARYLLWAYAFKLGMYFIILGALTRIDMPTARKWVVAAGGFIYIAFAYIPLPAPASIVFGIAGGGMTVMMLYAIWRWVDQRSGLSDRLKTAGDYRLAGYFFFAMATYTLCPLLGVKAFALSPEKMIRYGLQGEAKSFAFHLLIELTLGWLFIVLSERQSALHMRETIL